MAINNLYDRGISQGWKVRDGAALDNGSELEADVVIIGSGAGGSSAADILSAAGINVLILEAGALNTSDNFKDMDETRAYRELYQEGGLRASEDGAISILQGRSVGGGTVVNWTTSLRTPTPTLKYWADEFAVKGLSEDALKPHFQAAEKQLGISPWRVAPNPNNQVLGNGCEQLGWSYKVIPRNVKGCWNLGYCGMGCPTNAKQSMLVNRIPAALERGAELIYNVDVQRLNLGGGSVKTLSADIVDPVTHRASGKQLSVRAKHFILAGGALNSPALLLRSEAPDPHNTLGKRSSIHPVNATVAWFKENIEGYYGAPQSLYSDQFLFPNNSPAEGPIGYKLEAAPTFPMIISAAMGAHGELLQQRMENLPRAQMMVALMRDGFDQAANYGTVKIDKKSGQPQLHYPLTEAMQEAMRRAYLSMAELQFAAGAERVKALHLDSPEYTSWAEAKAGIAELRIEKHRMSLFSAHQMGGCNFGEDPNTSVCDSRGRHHQLDNLSIMDGSLFPSSLGANPQLSIYGIVGKLATDLAADLAADLTANPAANPATS